MLHLQKFQGIPATFVSTWNLNNYDKCVIRFGRWGYPMEMFFMPDESFCMYGEFGLMLRKHKLHEAACLKFTLVQDRPTTGTASLYAVIFDLEGCDCVTV